MNFIAPNCNDDLFVLVNQTVMIDFRIIADVDAFNGVINFKFTLMSVSNFSLECLGLCNVSSLLLLILKLIHTACLEQVSAQNLYLFLPL